MSQKLYYFNPGHESAIQNTSPYYTAPANLVNMQADLSHLPAWYADNVTDFVLINKPLSRNFKKEISNNLFLAKGITTKELALKSPCSTVHLWGKSPQALHYFDQLNNQNGLNLQLPIWNENLLQLTSRETAKECLKQLTDNILSIHEIQLPQYCNSLEDVESIVRNSDCQLLAKAPYSSSGRGLLWLPIGELTRVERQILHGIIRKQEKVSIEKVLDKQLDFAMEFDVTNQGVNFEGYSLFQTNSKGAYISNFIGSQANIEKTITSYIDLSILEEVKSELISILKNKFSSIYEGCVGVDMMVYKESGVNRLHPCIEINIRDNMGLLAISIYRKHITQGSNGFLFLDFSREDGDLLNKDKQMREQHPLLIENNRIKSGYVSLCPVLEKTNYRAYLIIDN